MGLSIREKGKMNKTIMLLFIIRVCLWITAFAATVYWIYYSVKLHMNDIFEPAEFASYFRPVFYTCVIISILAICMAFALYSIGKRLNN